MTDILLTKWAINTLNAKDYQLASGNADIIQANPWSTVLRFSTDKGYVFLKHVPVLLSLEPDVINMLHKEFNANVPVIIAESKEQHCFLMQDAGIRLYDYFKHQFN